MTEDFSARERFFPAIETRHGEPIAVWFERLAALGETARYPDQIAMLQQQYQMSRAHANALVMTHRGSTHARRFTDLDAYLAALTPPQKTQIETLVTTIADAFSQLSLTIAYNQPMFRCNGKYVVGLSASTNHVSLNPFSQTVVAAFACQFAAKMTTTHTFKFALDAPIDTDLVRHIVAQALIQVAQ